MAKKTVVIDVDDVLFGLNEAVEVLLRETHPCYSRLKVRTWDFNKSLTPQSKAELGICQSDETNGLGVSRDLIYNKIHSASTYTFSQRFQYDVPRFKELCDKCNVVLHTSGTTVDVCKAKVAMLNAYLNNMGVVACITVSQTGEMIPEYYEEGDLRFVCARKFVDKPALFCDYVVDDCIQNLMVYPDSVKKFLPTKSYNSARHNEHLSEFLDNPARNVERVADVNTAINIILSEVG